MAVVIDGTNGITTPLDVEIQGATSGSIVLAAPAVAGTNTQTLVAATGTLAPLIAGTAVASTSGTSIDFTSIPSWVKRITVMFSGVSTNGTSEIQIQLGDAGGVEATGYLGSWVSLTSAGSTSNATTGFLLFTNGGGSAFLRNGTVTISLLDPSTKNWSANGIVGLSDSGRISFIGGSKSLSEALDRVRITTVNGTDTFDAGSINIMYE